MLPPETSSASMPAPAPCALAPPCSRGSSSRGHLSHRSRGDALSPSGLPHLPGMRGFICLAAKGRSLNTCPVFKVTLLVRDHSGAFQKPQGLRSEHGREEVQSIPLLSCQLR